MRSVQLVAIVFAGFFCSLCCGADFPDACDITATEAQVYAALSRNQEGNSVEAISTTEILPAGGTAEIVLKQPYRSEVSYRALAVTAYSESRPPAVMFLIPPSAVIARPIRSHHPLAEKKVVAGNTASESAVQVPPTLGQVW